jgi:hypothetical protein
MGGPNYQYCGGERRMILMTKSLPKKILLNGSKASPIKSV